MDAPAQVRLFEPTPEAVSALWRKFYERRQFYPGGLAINVPEFVALVTAPDTIIYEVGEFGGVIWFTGITTPDEVGPIGEPRCAGHVMIWDHQWLGRPELGRAVCGKVMHDFGLARIISDIPETNEYAIAYGKAVGFNVIGRFRRRFNVKGKWIDSVIMDLIPADLRDRSETQHGQRHRRLRSEGPEERRDLRGRGAQEVREVGREG